MPPRPVNVLNPQLNNGAAAAIANLASAMRAGRYPWWYPDKAKGMSIDYFAYGLDFVPLGASATVQSPLQISGDSAFIVLSAVLVETDTANTTFLAQRPLLAQIRDGGSDRGLSNVAIHVDNWFGTAQEPKYWDVPKIIAPNSTLLVQLQNLEATARNVRLAFHGFKIFPFTPTGS